MNTTPLPGFDILSWLLIPLYSTPSLTQKVCVYSNVDKNACSKRIEEIYCNPRVVSYITCLHERSYSLIHATRLFHNYYLHAWKCLKFTALLECLFHGVGLNSVYATWQFEKTTNKGQIFLRQYSNWYSSLLWSRVRTYIWVLTWSF